MFVEALYTNFQTATKLSATKTTVTAQQATAESCTHTYKQNVHSSEYTNCVRATTGARNLLAHISYPLTQQIYVQTHTYVHTHTCSPHTPHTHLQSQDHNPLPHWTHRHQERRHSIQDGSEECALQSELAQSPWED